MTIVELYETLKLMYEILRKSKNINYSDFTKEYIAFS